MAWEKGRVMVKVLLIDDEMLVQLSVRQVLETAGHDVTVAGNGRDALALFENEDFDLVITDIIMPDMEGIEVITRLKKVRAGVRILAMSGGGRVGNMGFLKLARKAGARAVIAKPFTGEEFLDRVEEVLNG